MIELFQLGTAGNEPSDNRALASAFIRIKGIGFLIDAGEGTQMEICKCSFSCADIDYILITHLHADHISGLMGVLLAAKSASRVRPITIVGPVGIQRFVENMYQVIPRFKYGIKFMEIQRDRKETSFEVNDINIRICSVYHSVPCYAYSLELLRKPKFDGEKADKLGIPPYLRGKMMNGEIILHNGVSYSKSDFLSGPRKGLKVSYVTDTRPTSYIKEFINGSDIVVIEGMYRDNREQDKAKLKKHMTWDEVASLVNNNDIGEVILTHYSPSLRIEKSDSVYLKSKIPNGSLGRDGLYREIKWEEDKKEVKEMKRIEDYRKRIVEKCYQDAGFGDAVLSIEPITAFKFKVLLVGDVTHIAYVYKSIKSMKDKYTNMSVVDDNYVFLSMIGN